MRARTHITAKEIMFQNCFIPWNITLPLFSLKVSEMGESQLQSLWSIRKGVIPSDEDTFHSTSKLNPCTSKV